MFPCVTLTVSGIDFIVENNVLVKNTSNNPTLNQVKTQERNVKFYKKYSKHKLYNEYIDCLHH